MDGIMRLLYNPVFVSAGIIAVSVFALAAALISEYVFGLEPCILCIYQRYPYVAAILLGALGIVMRQRGPMVAAMPVAMAALAFGVNSGIAFHHVGVEQGWWETKAGCNVDFSGQSQNASSVLAQMLKTPAVPCDQIPWQDPVFGVSMAGYNFILCLALALGCFMCSILVYRSR